MCLGPFYGEEEFLNNAREKAVDLSGTVALVTGASRGVGKGIAIGLGEAGATVYITGRSEKEGDGVGPRGPLPGTIHQTAEEVTQAGGKGIAICCDHTTDSDVEAVFNRIKEDEGRLDILVNNAWGGYERMFVGGEYVNENPFWMQPMWRWDSMFETGVRSAFHASGLAMKMMLKQKAGLVVQLSFWAAQTYLQNTPYGVAKAAVDRMTADMAHELALYATELGNPQVAIISLYPGLVRTESVMEASEFFDLSNSESPQFLGRVVAALFKDTRRMERTGHVVVAAQAAMELGVVDIDGKQPRPLTLKDLG